MAGLGLEEGATGSGWEVMVAHGHFLPLHFHISFRRGSPLTPFPT